MAKKKNPQDATLRNIRALKKRVHDLEIVVARFAVHLDRTLPAKVARGK